MAMFEIGFSLGIGMVTGAAGVLSLGLIGTKGIEAMFPPSWKTYDATDDAANGKRSGASLVTDYGTSCEYLRAPGGGITPRLDANGKPICRQARKAEQ